MAARHRVTGNISLSNTPVRDGLATFHIESDSSNLFVHLKGIKDNVLVYQGWLRWFGDDVSFHLNSPALDSGSPPFQFKALLEDWTDYGMGRKPTVITELDFTVE